MEMIHLDIKKTLLAPDGDINFTINLSVEKGQLVTLYGESGAGKTCTLRMLAGLLTPDQGSISVNGQHWYDSKSKVNLSPQKRKIGYVFQDYALFPHLTVKQNLEFALLKGQSQQKIQDLLKIVELENLQNRKPETLSGGQKQRVALARALVQEPEILL